jgi:hypothetical protein
VVSDGYYRNVPNLPFPPQPSGPPPWPPPPPDSGRSPQLLVIASLVIALIALGVAIGSWFRPLLDNRPILSPSPPTYSEQQVAAAKTDVCAAYHQVRKALDAAGARNGGNEPTTSLAVATASRQALDAGSRYLLTKLAEDPAANPDLANAVRKLADIYQQITIGYLADASDAEMEPLRQAADQPTATIDGLCK